MSLSVNTHNPMSTKKLVATAATGAAIGAGASYFLQKQAIKVADAKKAAAAAEANKKGLAKLASKLKNGAIWVALKVKNGAMWAATKIKDGAKFAKTKITDGLVEIGKNGKISKMGIVKTAAAAALFFPAIIVTKNLLSGNKKD